MTADTSGVETIGSSPLAGYPVNYAVQYPTVHYPTVQRTAVHYNPGVQYYIPTVHQVPVVDNTPVVDNRAVRVVDNSAVRQVVGKPVYQIGFQGLQPVVAAPALPAERIIMQVNKKPNFTSFYGKPQKSFFLVDSAPRPLCPPSRPSSQKNGYKLRLSSLKRFFFAASLNK